MAEDEDYIVYGYTITTIEDPDKDTTMINYYLFYLEHKESFEAISSSDKMPSPHVEGGYEDVVFSEWFAEPVSKKEAIEMIIAYNKERYGKNILEVNIKEEKKDTE